MKKLIPANAILIPDAAACVFEGEIFAVHQWPQEMFDGSMATFEMLKRPDTTQVICVVDGKIVVLDEEQPNNRQRRNFPGGRVDATDSDIVAAARREVLEEVGYEFANWKLLKVSQPQAKLEWFVYLLLAWEVTADRPAALEPGEKIQPALVSFDDVKREALAGIGYLGDSADVFEAAATLDALLALPAFEGREVDR